MSSTMRKKQFFLIFLFIAAIAYYWMCIKKGPEYYKPKVLATHSTGAEFVGSKTCMECHAEIYDSHLLTAHYNTSALANSDNLKGSFEAGSNTISLKETEVEMLREGNVFYQETKDKNTGKRMPPETMDIVIGSGVKGQSFLNWKVEKLFQLQASYYPAADRWINSPGYPDFRIQRPVRDGCLKCHVTHATNRDFSGKGNRYDRNRMLYGVDCERCHQPGEKHVTFHRNNPKIAEAKFMLKLDTLSRQLRLDACAQCHSGSREAILKGTSFSYLTGEPLEEYSRNFYKGQSTSELDVHGNQYGLLTSSKCFKQSLDMDCGTCHDPHKNQRGDVAHFNQKCVGCHNSSKVECKGATAEINSMGNNCIACHMPNTPSKIMSFQLGDSETTPVYVRTHLIGIYSKDKEILESKIDKDSVKQLGQYIKEKMAN